MADPLISKSKFIAGQQCPKLLWTYYNDKSQIPETDLSTQAIFDQGHIVGQLATSLFPGGTLIEWSEDFGEMTARSKAALLERKPIFEASFSHGGAFARADILEPVPSDGWDLIEVKSSTEVKDVHLQDVAFQKYVYEGAGIPIRRCHVMHIDNSYVRHGDVSARKLFKRVDVTQQADSILPGIPDQIEVMGNIIRSKTCPKAEIGGHCTDPYPCPLKDSCWSFLPERSVFSLYYGGARAMNLMQQGILKLRDIPNDFSLTDKQEIQVECEKSGQPHVDKEAIAHFLGQLRYPLYFLDFETFMTAIPAHDLVRPYQQVPFQYSLCILRSPGGEVEHAGYLADGSKDPRPEILSGLRSRLGTAGSIVAYNASFETRILLESADCYPEYCDWARRLTPRFVDLLAPFRSFSYYHPDQQGSASLKAVLPALTGLSYDPLEIADGSTASLKFLDMAFGGLPESECIIILHQLENYCAQDASGMIEILHCLERLIHKS